MKIYLCRFHDHDDGKVLSWHHTAEGARKRLRTLQAERTGNPAGPEGVELVEIPAGQIALVNWLNRHVTRDNG
jgi:hypothetical protein